MPQTHAQMSASLSLCRKRNSGVEAHAVDYFRYVPSLSCWTCVDCRNQTDKMLVAEDLLEKSNKKCSVLVSGRPDMMERLSITVLIYRYYQFEI